MGKKQSKLHPRYETCTWGELLDNIKEISINYRAYLARKDEYLAFALRNIDFQRGPEGNWKSEILIFCCHMNAVSQSVKNYKKMSFLEFLYLFDMHKLMLTNQENKKNSMDRMSTSQFILAQTSDDDGNCVICMENKNDLLLPCLHSFCFRCIVAEKEYRQDFSCPLCKTKVGDPILSSWEVPDAPDQEEVNEYFWQIHKET